MQIQISWLLQKPTDLDLHYLQNRVYPGSAGQRLRLLDALDRFSIIVSHFTRETSFMTSCLLSFTPGASSKGVYSKWKEFAFLGSRFFTFRVDPFSEGEKNYLQCRFGSNCFCLTEAILTDIQNICSVRK